MQVEPAKADYRGMNVEFRNNTIMKSTSFQRHLTRFCAENSIACFDMLPGFQQIKSRNPDERLYFAIDQHFRPSGHRAATELMMDWITQSNE
ncbi:hypothetical protein JXA32_11290 [Candidatus Sumerlaeota bacterium]|nr:hypothetical protein [Candidatus Sumerlaeota bacterium]